MMMIFNFFIGAALGSHALVIVQRNNDKSFINSLSRCDSCQFPLTLLDQIPIISYLCKRGRCTHCNEPIPLYSFFIEIISGIAFYNIFPFSRTGYISAIFLFFFLLAAIFDYFFLEFETIILLLPTIIAVGSPESAVHYFSFTNWILLIFLILIMSYMNLKNTFGIGDTLFFILISLYKGQIFGLHVLLMASILFLLFYIFNRNNDYQPFLPFIFISYILI
ncbi:A24 family peptidase [Lactobacillus sp. PV034]|uniref:prepilin peptidase n=1 Tax=Lactobacillus sp. PV034 TaxID=2594495 RepID=UPI00223F7E94|nr:A24 family peptidase [Lactobacillus sp. PV034]QNQ81346.1 prepilin peptidase [Lactobacillus sp. PV034]